MSDKPIDDELIARMVTAFEQAPEDTEAWRAAAQVATDAERARCLAILDAAYVRGGWGDKARVCIGAIIARVESGKP